MEELRETESTLCLVKPDGIRRGMVGQILTRFERAGLKISAMKMLIPDFTLASQHYTYEDIAIRHGEDVYKALIDFVTSGPVLAFVLEGVCAIANVRKLCGTTEPLQAACGTIRGDFCHQNFRITKVKNMAVRNLIHASASPEEALREIAVWFKPDELCSYRRCDQSEHFLD